jgi:hypothetical protein
MNFKIPLRQNNGQTFPAPAKQKFCSMKYHKISQISKSCFNRTTAKHFRLLQKKTNLRYEILRNFTNFKIPLRQDNCQTVPAPAKQISLYEISRNLTNFEISLRQNNGQTFPPLRQNNGQTFQAPAKKQISLYEILRNFTIFEIPLHCFAKVCLARCVISLNSWYD